MGEYRPVNREAEEKKDFVGEGMRGGVWGQSLGDNSGLS